MILFHRFLIGVAVLFTGGTGWWMIQDSRNGGSVAQMILGIVFLFATVGLAYYLKNLNRFLKRP